MTDIKLVVADDGSTACKLAFFNEEDKDEVSTLISSNRAELGCGFSFGTLNYSYTTNDELKTKYTFSDEKDALPTSNKAFQYHEQSRASVHHALVKSGIKADNIKLCVTLPINQFYNNDGTENTINIAKKKETHLGYISSDNHKTYNICDVVVYPEGIPAMLLALDDDILPTDTSLLIDIGGTTADLCLFNGKLNNIMNMDSLNCGMTSIMDSIKSELNQSMNNIYTMHLDFILRNFNNPEEIYKNIHCDVDVMKHARPILEKLYRNIVEFNKGAFTNTRIYLTGGGAIILNAFLTENGVSSKIIDNSETALAKSILLLNQ